MYSKVSEKEKAIALRKTGLSYSEILKEVKVAKSTLSLWFKEIKLSKPQKQALTQKKIEAALRGAHRRTEQRMVAIEKAKQEAIQEVGKIDKKTMLMVGAALYWAEGSKQKTHNVAAGVIFSNSDPEMIKYFYKWLIFCGNVEKERIYFELYIHKDANVKLAQKFWSKVLGLPIRLLSKVRFKKGNLLSFRKNKGRNYYGLIRIRVRKSTNLNRKIMGLVDTLIQQFNYQHSGLV